MNIALIAHDTKKELMTEFCIAYCGILDKHQLCATGTTGSMIQDATGLNIETFSSAQGGEEQIAARIACNEIDLVIFFRDGAEHIQDNYKIQDYCDRNNIPYATNIATAEMLILGLDQGLLDWRNVINR